MAKTINFKSELENLKKRGLLKRASEIEPKKIESYSSLKTIFNQGEYIETPHKRVFKIRYNYGLNEKIGNVMIKDFFNLKDKYQSLLCLLGKNNQLNNFEINKLLFFDVESTGLTSGAGNLVFLIGLGYFENEEFIIDQYFIEDFLNEQGLLYLLKEIFSRKNHLFSFNGKSFDFHILKNRFILSRRFEFPLNNLLHFDLLHSSRRMWKNLFNEFSLSNLEKQVLGFQRSSKDIPGYLIPEYYKRYLKSKDAKIVESIFYHNAMDVKSMLGLLIIQLQNIDYIQKGIFPEDINSKTIADLFKKNNEEIYIDLLIHSCNKNNKNAADSLKELYLYYKRKKQYDNARQTLNKLIDITNNFNYYFYKELSIIYEWHEKNYQAAYDILNQAMTRMEHLTKLNQQNFDKEIDDLNNRIERVKKRC